MGSVWVKVSCEYLPVGRQIGCMYLRGHTVILVTASCNSLRESHGSLESEHGHVTVETIGPEVWMSNNVVDLEFLGVTVHVTQVPLSHPHRELAGQEPDTRHRSNGDDFVLFDLYPAARLLDD